MEEFLLGKINRENLIQKFGKEFSPKELDELLEEAISKNENSDSNQLFYNLLWCLPVSMTAEEKDALFKKYISIPKGHFEHEEMLGHFQKEIINPEKNIEIFKQLILNPPNYFVKHNCENVFIEKCLFTIAKQPTLKTKETLLNFSLSPNKNIQRASKLYLERITKGDQ